MPFDIAGIVSFILLISSSYSQFEGYINEKNSLLYSCIVIVFCDLLSFFFSEEQAQRQVQRNNPAMIKTRDFFILFYWNRGNTFFKKINQTNTICRCLSCKISKLFR